MEDRLSAPLPLLSIDQESLESSSIKSVPSTTGPFTTPGPTDDTHTVIQWQAAELLNKINREVLIKVFLSWQGPVWITRIPHQQRDSRFLVDQVEPFIRAKKKFKFGVPYLYHYGFAEDEENAIGVDYMLLDFMAGRQMLMWTETFPTTEQKKQVLDQLADIYMEMFTKPATFADRLALRNSHNLQGMQADFDAFDIPPLATTSTYLNHLADETIRGKIQRLLADDAEEQTQQLKTTMEHRYQDFLTLLMMRALIPTQVIGRYNDSPFYITHPDLHNRNIIIEGKMVPEKPQQLRSNGSTMSESSAASKHEIPLQRKCSCSDIKRDEIKINGIVDWDKAHPIPLQCAAIYPKFLETLPGAEFPDLPGNYRAPDLSHEKKMFLDILRKKELAKTGATIVSDLIEKGSWERDFFHVALDRGDVRQKWFAWWKAEQTKQYGKHAGIADELLRCDIDNIRSGLQAFLAKPDNIAVIEQCRGWNLIARVIHDIEMLEMQAMDSCWIPSTPRRLNKKPLPRPRRDTGSHVASRVREYNRKLSLGGGSQSQPKALSSTVISKPAEHDKYLNFMLGDEPGRVIKVKGKERTDVGL
ncbi:hypothetical protein OHC33_009505 [Knufia fluminis]|uniref:Aminoglycoside phosphotransferase domain-containing protein n=1 Tax=Knufia fluminis TaxID=191047 RepID=A0AAN8EFI7_9EURO|nr:hypothetical protein OHC33_009505 [Knufia fluminis]